MTLRLIWAIVFSVLYFNTEASQKQKSHQNSAESASTVTVSFGEKGNSPGYIGSLEEVKGQQVVAAFKGIPYAKSPVGELRYKPPIPFLETEVRNVTQYSAPCLQWDLFGNQNITGSEDCLHLNVFVVQSHLKSESDLWPVMVFFHGVGFVAGQSDTYNPAYLVQKGVIVVTVQYRLGALGFLSSGDSLQPGNMGLMDQVEGLRWVNKNIHYFKGDSKKVTIFGQSAGAVAVSLHLVSPLAKGLFHRAIIQSGTLLAPFTIQKHPKTHIQRLGSNLGCISTDTKTLLDCIRFSDPREVIATDALGLDRGSGNERKSSRSNKKPPSAGPVVQTEEAVGWPMYLNENPTTALTEGRFNKVPVILGVTRDESASAVLNSLIPRLSNVSALDPKYPERVFLKKVIKGSGFTNNTEVLKLAVKFEYFKNYPMADVSELRDEYINLQSDFSIIAPVYQTALLLSKATPTYFYSFEYEGLNSFAEILTQAPDREPRKPQQRSKRQLEMNEKEILEITPELAAELEKLGGEALHLHDHNRYVIHGEELLYLFEFRNPTTNSVIGIEDTEGIHVREIMTTLWYNMAQFGMPTTNDTQLNVTVPWKPFSVDAPYTLRISEKTSLLISYRYRKMLFWSTHLPELEAAEIHSYCV